MTYQETLYYLYSRLPMFQNIGAAAYKANLDNTYKISELLGKPHLKLKCIHVAGTNGKGSSSHMLAAILQKSGYIPESIRDKSGGYGYNEKYDPDTSIKKDAFEGRDPRYSWINPGFSQTERDPVTNITWNDAVNLAKWLSKKEGKKYRLPTEAEWEYACLAKTQSRFGVGDDPRHLSFYANVYDQSALSYWGKWNNFAQKDSDGFPFTAPVGSFKPNSYGLYDMNGNVWEWVSDFYSDQYPSDAVTNPTGPPSGDLRVRRGGSWHTWALYARCQFRNWNTADTRYTLVGVRLLLEKHDRPIRIKQVHRRQNQLIKKLSQ